MSGTSAVGLAFDLARRPALARAMRRQPLPDDVLTVIKIAAGSDEVCRTIATRAGMGVAQVREAAIVYLQAVVLHSQADSYRVLGAPRGSNQAVLREHMGWLMKWLHPDRDQSDWESALAQRVSAAWEDLKSPERRARYDRSLGQGGDAPRHRPRPMSAMRTLWQSEPIERARVARFVAWAAFALASGIVLAVAFAPTFNGSGVVASESSGGLVAERAGITRASDR